MPEIGFENMHITFARSVGETKNSKFWVDKMQFETVDQTVKIIHQKSLIWKTWKKIENRKARYGAM